MNALNPVQVTYVFGFGKVADPNPERGIGVQLGVKPASTAHFVERWTGLIVVAPSRLHAWLAWMSKAQSGYIHGQLPEPFEMRGLAFEAVITEGGGLKLKLATHQLAMIKGLRWEGNILKWPDWYAPLLDVRNTLRKALAHQNRLEILPVSQWALPENIV